MRTITGNIKILTDDFANKKISFTLCDLYGRKLNSFDLENEVATVKSSDSPTASNIGVLRFISKISTIKNIITDANGNFSVELFETEESQIPMYYRMHFIDNNDIDDIKIFVQNGNGTIDFLKLLFPYPKLNMFFKTDNEKVTFNDTVFELFEKFFTKEDNFVNSNEKNILEEYVNYADEIRDSELMERLDKYLGEIHYVSK